MNGSSEIIVGDLVAELERAWNVADGSGFGAVFAEDADFIDIRGAHHRGRLAIGHGHQAIFDTVYAGSTVRYRVVDATQIAAGSVLGIVRATLDAPGGPLAGVHESTVSLVAIEEVAGWKVRSFHNTLVSA